MSTLTRSNLLCSASLILLFSAAGFAETSVVQPDNSKVNQHYQSAREVTAQDQGSSDRDIELTQKIRRKVVEQKAFSLNAKNIKIISIDGTVTLKGPVKSASEKKQIERIAMRIAGASKVTSEIEIAQ
jgi:hyperosmotically inducible protein